MMTDRKTIVVGCMVIVAGLISTVSLVRPQDYDGALAAGEAQYLSKCANCHGADGKGTGPHSATLKTRPADLTLLAKHNHGIFPVSEVYQLIDGRSSVRKHLSNEMPIWGCRQSSPRRADQKRHKHSLHMAAAHKPPVTSNLESFMNLTCDSEQIIAQRIMSVVAYLSYIQAK